MKRLFIITICLLALGATFIAADDKEVKADPPKIGFLQGHTPQPIHLLGTGFSKMKTYLENEFSTTVDPVNGSWTSGNLSGYDILILPTRFAQRPSVGELSALKSWTRNGGSLIILWYSLCEGACTGNPDPTTNWPGTQLHDTILQDTGKIMVRSQFASGTDMTSFMTDIGTTPHNIGYVSGGNAAWLYSVAGDAKFIASNGFGQYVAAYNNKVDNGKMFVIGNLDCFTNAFIDFDDNKDFLFNIIAEASGDDGGGGGGGGGGGVAADLYVKKTIPKPKLVNPGDTMKLIGIVRNKGTDTSDPDRLDFYLSKDETFDGDDIFVGAINVPAINKKKRKRLKLNSLAPDIDADVYYLIGRLASNDDTKASKKTIEFR